MIDLDYRKISWFASGEQINYLPKPKTETLTSWRITLLTTVLIFSSVIMNPIFEIPILKNWDITWKII